MIVYLLALLSALAADTQIVTVSASTTKQVGQFDGNRVPEISGLAVSSKYDHTYIHNDSGDSGRFFVTSLTGTHISTVNISGSSPSDNEDMSVGPCGAGSCLYIGDIGDNGEERSSVKLVLVEEKETFPSSIPIYKTFKIKYSDGRPHNCEAMNVHPITGDAFFFTKTSGRAKLYKVAAQEFAKASGSTLTAKEIGTVALNELFSNADMIVTGMAISPDGFKFSVITYTDIYEFNFDLSSSPAVGTDQLIQVSRARYIAPKLKQQEAIAYSPRTGRLLYTTEANGSSTVPLIQVSTVNF